MKWVLALPLLLVALAAPAGESIVAGLSQSRVSITANFDGSEILIYGAVKRDAPAPATPLEVVITVEGPSTPMTIRRKDRVAGIWINNEAVHIDSAPTFYAVATTSPLISILSETEDLRHKISLDRVIRSVGITTEADNAEGFTDSLIRIRRAQGNYSLQEGSVLFYENTLFRADVALPANLTEGDYRVRIFLTRDGAVVDSMERVIGVRKEGLERFLFRLAHDQPLIYGLISLLLAVVAGWGASEAFRLMQR